MNVLGSVLQNVATGKHIGVSSRGDTICTLHKDDDRSCITLYNYKEKQFSKIKSFPSPLSYWYQSFTVALGSNVIYITNIKKQYIYTLSMDGTLLGTYGREGGRGAGMLQYPRAAATDGDDNLLVCDWSNRRLQVMTRDGKWHIVRTDKDMELPWDTAVDGDNLYVLGARYLYHFKIQ